MSFLIFLFVSQLVLAALLGDGVMEMDTVTIQPPPVQGPGLNLQRLTNPAAPGVPMQSRIQMLSLPNAAHNCV